MSLIATELVSYMLLWNFNTSGSYIFLYHLIILKINVFLGNLYVEKPQTMHLMRKQGLISFFKGSYDVKCL